MWGSHKNSRDDDDDDDNSAMLTITGQWNIDAELRAPPPRRAIQQRSSSSSGDGGGGSSHGRNDGGGDRDSGRFSFTEKNRSNSGRFSFTDKSRSGSGYSKEGKAARFSFGEKNRSASGLLGIGGNDGASSSSSAGKGDGNLGLTGSERNDSSGRNTTRGSSRSLSGSTGKKSSSSSSRFSFSDKNRSGSFGDDLGSIKSGLFSVAEASRSEDEDSGSNASDQGSVPSPSTRPSRYSFGEENRSFSSVLLSISGQDIQEEEDDAIEAVPEPPKTWKQRASDFYWENEVTILLTLSIVAAKPYPKLGAVYLVPQVTSSWIAVMVIFIASGIGIKTRDFTAAMFRMKINLFVQTFSFGALSFIVFGSTRALIKLGVLLPELGNGLVMVACVPATINSVAVLTRQGGGDEAGAIFNSAFANFLGIFVSPTLILGYLGVRADVNMFEVFYTLALRVIVPVMLGQVLQRIRWVVRFVKKHKFAFKQSTLYGLVWIVYTVFCRTFMGDRVSELKDIFIMVLVVVVLYVVLLAIAWLALKIAFRDKPKVRVMGIFGCSFKSVAMGIPLIEAIYGGDPNIALYTLPLLVWYPIQIIVGSLMADWLRKFVRRENARLGIDEEVLSLDSDDDSLDFLPVENEDKNKDIGSRKSSKTKKRKSKKKKKRSGGSKKSSRSRKKLADDSSHDSSTVHTHDSRYDDPHMGYGYENRSVMDIGDSTVWTYEDDMTLAPDHCASDHFCLEEGVVYERLMHPDAIACIPGSNCISCYRVIASDIHELGVIPTEQHPVFVCMKCRTFAFCNQCWRDNLTDMATPSGFVSTFFKSLADYY